MSYKSTILLFPILFACHTHTPTVQIIDPVENSGVIVLLKDSIILDSLEGAVVIDYRISEKGKVIDINVEKFFLKNDFLNLRFNYDADSIYTEEECIVFDSIKCIILNHVQNMKVHHDKSSGIHYPSSIGMLYRIYKK